MAPVYHGGLGCRPVGLGGRAVSGASARHVGDSAAVRIGGDMVDGRREQVDLVEGHVPAEHRHDVVIDDDARDGERVPNGRRRGAPRTPLPE